MNRISCILSSLPDDLGPTCNDFLQLSSIPFQVPQTLSELNQVIVAATDSKQKIRSDFFHPHQLFFAGPERKEHFDGHYFLLWLVISWLVTIEKLPTKPTHPQPEKRKMSH